MPTVETTIRVTIAERPGLGEVEQAVAEQLQAAGRELLVGLCAAIEEQVLAETSGLRPDKQRGWDLLTRFGWVRLPRWQLQDTTTGRYLCPVDAVLGVRPRQHASPWVLGQAVALATRVPYRQATQLLCGWVQDRVDHRTVFAWVRAAGAQVVAEEDQQQEAVFAQGEPAACDATAREIVVAQVDGTFLKAQREAGADFELRLVGVAKALGVGDPDKVLEHSVRRHQQGFYGARRLREQLSPQAQLVYLPVGRWRWRARERWKNKWIWRSAGASRAKACAGQERGPITWSSCGYAHWRAQRKGKLRPVRGAPRCARSHSRRFRGPAALDPRISSDGTGKSYTGGPTVSIQTSAILGHYCPGSGVEGLQFGDWPSANRASRSPDL